MRVGNGFLLEVFKLGHLVFTDSIHCSQFFVCGVRGYGIDSDGMVIETVNEFQMEVIFKLSNNWGTINAKLKVDKLSEAFRKLKFGTVGMNKIFPKFHIVLSLSN